MMEASNLITVSDSFALQWSTCIAHLLPGSFQKLGAELNFASWERFKFAWLRVSI